jgi:GT2 family glycosyltransferase
VLCGAAFACRRDQFLRLGGFDPRYQPFYWEDVGLGYQALAAGQRNVTVPGALVIHRHSESISRKVGERKLRYLLRNQLRFVQAHRSQLRPELKHEHLWWLLRSGRSLLQGDLEFAGAYLKAALGL